MYFHELKAVIENGLDWSAEFPENRGNHYFLGPKKNLENLYILYFQFFNDLDRAQKIIGHVFQGFSEKIENN
jgi:hypothetical protein